MERNLGREAQEKENYQQAVRSFVVSLASPEEIYKSLIEGDKFYCLRFYVCKKGDEEEGYRYTFFGGKVNPYENFFEAAQREIAEEGNFRFFGIPGQTNIGKQWRYSCKKSGGREVILTYNPVLPTKTLERGNGIAGIVSLNIDQLEKLIEEGTLNEIPIEGHLTIASTGDIEISEADNEIKNEALTRGIGWMSHIENYLRKKFEFEGLITKAGNFISPEEFEKEYQKTLSEFMRRGLEVAIGPITNLQEHTSDTQPLNEALNSGYLGKDILFYLPHLAQYGLEWESLSKAPEGVRTFIEFLKGVFDGYLSTINLSQKEYQEFLKNKEIPLEQKKQLIDQLDQYFRKKLKEVFGLSNHNLDKTMSYIQNFFKDLSNELKVADHNLTRGLYQDYVLVNEVNNGNFGYLLSLFLGYDTKENLESERLIRFEAGRQLLLLLKALGSIKYYKSQIEKVRNGRFQQAINNFFGPITREETIKIENNIPMRVRIREIDSQEYIVDERPTKTFTSFLRKSFEESPSNIRDFYSISVVFINNDVNNIQQNVNNLIKKFLDYLNSQYESFEAIIEARNDYGTEKFLSDSTNQVELIGKRKGSQSSQFVRTKLYISLRNKNSKEIVETMEMAIYPICSTGENSNYFGWLEKIRDDKNYVVRRLLAGEKGISSFYDLLFPPELYSHHYQHKLKSNYHS